MKAVRTTRGRFTWTALAIAMAVALGALATGCTGATTEAPSKAAGAATEAFPVTITDDASRSVTIDAEPARIVSLAPANTEIVAGLGIFDRLVGVTTYDDYPAEVKDVPKVGDFMTPNLEAIAAAKPDLILVTGGVQADVLSQLEGVGAQVVVVDPQDLEGVFEAITDVARMTGTSERGEELLVDMKTQLVEIEDKLAGAEPVPAFIEIGWNPLFTAGPGTLLDDLLKSGGGTNVVAQPGYVSYSAEQLMKDQPSVYLGTRSSIGEGTGISGRPGYKSLKPVVDGRIGILDDNLVSRPGPRVVEGVLEIAKALHPDRF